MYNNEKLVDLFKYSEDYPENVAEKGVPENTLFCYISDTFLNGFINYVNPFYVVMAERYTTWTMDSIYRVENNLAITKQSIKDLLELQPHTNYSKLPDDIHLLAESENDYWYFWSDKDSSDCCIGRLNKNTFTKENIIKALKEQLKCNKIYCKNNSYMELPLPKGWVTL